MVRFITILCVLTVKSWIGQIPVLSMFSCTWAECPQSLMVKSTMFAQEQSLNKIEIHFPGRERITSVVAQGMTNWKSMPRSANATAKSGSVLQVWRGRDFCAVDRLEYVFNMRLAMISGIIISNSFASHVLVGFMSILLLFIDLKYIWTLLILQMLFGLQSDIDTDNISICLSLEYWYMFGRCYDCTPLMREMPLILAIIVQNN